MWQYCTVYPILAIVIELFTNSFNVCDTQNSYSFSDEALRRLEINHTILLFLVTKRSNQ